MNAERRLLLEGLVTTLYAAVVELGNVKSGGAGLGSTLALQDKLMSVCEIATGALLGDLDDEASWCELLTMMVQEVADADTDE